MTARLPNVGPDLKVWARETRSYLQRWLPKLQWKMADSNPSENGVNLWDDAIGAPVVSRDGAWLPMMLRDQVGIVDYNDAATATTPITLTAGTWASLTNDTLGPSTNTSYLPTGVDSMINASGQIDCSDLTLGSFILIRPDFTITPDTNNQNVEFRYSLGTGANAYTLEMREGRMDSGSGSPYRYALDTHLIYMGDANTRDNPITIQVKTSGAGSVVNAGIAMIVYKR